MKKLIILFAIVFITKSVFAQKEALSIDEHNKYIYYQVAEQNGVSQHQLYENLLAGLKKNTEGAKVTAMPDTQIIVKSKLMLYSGLVKHEDGEMAYTLHVEFKNEKYRYWLTDFVFTPYQRDRYNNFVPVAGKEIALEQAKSKIDKLTLDSYMDQTYKFCKLTGENLKQYAENTQKPAENTKKVDTKKW